MCLIHLLPNWFLVTELNDVSLWRGGKKRLGDEKRKSPLLCLIPCGERICSSNKLLLFKEYKNIVEGRSNKGRAGAANIMFTGAAVVPLQKDLWLYCTSQRGFLEWWLSAEVKSLFQVLRTHQRTACVFWRQQAMHYISLTVLLKLTFLLRICRIWLKAYWGESL